MNDYLDFEKLINSFWFATNCLVVYFFVSLILVFLFTGLHYWYDLSKSMSCDRLFPMFLLYNNGVLNGFGWAFGMDLQTYSSRIEHPAKNSYKVNVKLIRVNMKSCVILHSFHLDSTLVIYGILGICVGCVSYQRSTKLN